MSLASAYSKVLGSRAMVPPSKVLYPYESWKFFGHFQVRKSGDRYIAFCRSHCHNPVGAWSYDQLLRKLEEVRVDGQGPRM